MERPDTPTRVYLDANLWIDAALGSGEAETVRELLRLAQVGKLEIIASTILLVEVRAKSRRLPHDIEESIRVHGYLQSSAITYVELDRYTASLARGIVESFRLDNFDAVHLASAVAGEAEVFMTTDADLLKVGDEYSGVLIGDPFVPDHLSSNPGLF